MAGEMVVVNVTDEELEACDTSNVENSFGKATGTIAKSAYARVYLTFSKYDKDPREVWEVDEVRAWIRKVADRVPFFPFFLVPHAQAGQMNLWILSLVDVKRTGAGQVEIDRNAAIAEIARIDKALRTFCTRIREDYPTVARSVFGSLPDELRPNIV